MSIRLFHVTSLIRKYVQLHSLIFEPFESRYVLLFLQPSFIVYTWTLNTYDKTKKTYHRIYNIIVLYLNIST